MYSDVRLHGHVLAHVDELLLVDVGFQDRVDSANLIASCAETYGSRCVLRIVIQGAHIDWILR